MATSAREVGGSLGQLALGGMTELKESIAAVKAMKAGDPSAIMDIRQRVQQDLQQQREAEQKKKEEMKTWERLIRSWFLKGLIMVMPSIFFGSFDFFGLLGLKNIMESAVDIAPKAYGKHRSKVQANRKSDIQNMFKDQQSTLTDTLLPNMLQEQAKKPAEIDGEALHKLFRGLQDSEIDNPPLTIAFPDINSNPKLSQRIDLFNKFKEIALSISAENLDYDLELFQM